MPQRGFLSRRLFERGLKCRADERGDPVVEISPALVAGSEEFDEIVDILGDVLDEAWQRVAAGTGSAARAPSPSAPEAPTAAARS